jgi:hypothetical protein
VSARYERYLKKNFSKRRKTEARMFPPQSKEDYMIINHNMSAMFAQNQLKVSNSQVSKNMEKLSSGLRINRAGDDASGLAVSEKMRSQIRPAKMLPTESALSRRRKDTFRKARIFCTA